MLALVSMLLIGLAGCASSPGGNGAATSTAGTGAPTSTAGGAAAGKLPHFDHIVIVIEENQNYDQIMGGTDTPYLHSLAQQGVVFTNAHAVEHPSEPNYLALFAGSTFGLTSDDCPQSFAPPDLGGELLAHGLRFTGYSESMPRAGFTGCDDGSTAADGDPLYARKHNPWVNFADVPAASNQPFSSYPSDFGQLPTVAFVVPNQSNDMHSGSIAAGDKWLQQHLDAYVRWAPAHNSLLIVTWDEDDEATEANHILTLFVGAHVQPGQSGQTLDHYTVLRTIEALYGLPFTRQAASAKTIADVWQP